MSALSALLQLRERPVVTAELPAINTGGVAKVEELLGRLSPYVDAVNATDNPAAHAHASNVAIAIAILQSGAEPVLQVVCRDKNRLAIQADIVGAALFGVENICALTGDDVTAGDEPEARRVFDLDGPQLIHVATRLASGSYLSGRTIDPPPRLFVGAVENPGAPPFAHRVLRAKKKSEIGAKFLQLQICYVVERMDEFVRGCLNEGITDRTALLPTICLTKSAKALEFMNEKVPGIHVPDEIIRRVRGASHQAEASFQLSLDLARTYLDMPGVAGLHLTDFRHDDSVARLTKELGLSASKASAPTTSSPYEEKHAHGSELPPAKEVIVGDGQPFCIIGERINPTGRKAFQQQLRNGDLSAVEVDVASQIAGGAMVLDVNMGAPLVDEADLLARAVRLVQSISDLPICIDSSVVEALEAGLAAYEGKALVNSVTAEDERLDAILPIVKRHGAAIIALPNDEEEIPEEPRRRLELVAKIVDVAHGKYQIPLEDIVIDPLAMPVGADTTLVAKTLETISLIKEHYGLNTTLGASNVSFGMPDRHALGAAFLPMAMTVGLTSAIMDARSEQIVSSIKAADLLLGRDDWGAQWISMHRARIAAGVQ